MEIVLKNNKVAFYIVVVGCVFKDKSGNICMKIPYVDYRAHNTNNSILYANAVNLKNGELFYYDSESVVDLLSDSFVEK